MRVNVYTEELPTAERPACQIVTADYISSRTGEPMTNYGLRIFLKSAPELHDSPKDDDRSAVTIWCGPKEKNIFEFLEMLRSTAYADTMRTWHNKTVMQQRETEQAIFRASAEAVNDSAHVSSATPGE